MWLGFHEIVYLTIPEEEHDTGFHHVLEDKVFIVVTDLTYVTHNQIIEASLPFASHLESL